jgi:hypothetical protein
MSKGQWAFRPAALTRVRAKIDSVTGKFELRFQRSGALRAETVNEWDGVE